MRPEFPAPPQAGRTPRSIDRSAADARTMDPLDLKILRTMGVRPYGPKPRGLDALKVGRVAKVLGVEPETVRSRLAKMEETGFLRGYQVYPNLNHLGLAAAAYVVRVPDEDKKVDAVTKVALIDGLSEVHNFLGAELCIDVAFQGPSDLSRKLKLLSEITGDRAPERFYDREMPEVRRPLTRLDWRILRALRNRATRPLSEVAEEVGASVKTVRRRHTAMAHEGSFFAVPAVDASRAPGMILYDLLFYTAPGATDRAVPRILELLRDRYLFHYIPPSQSLGNFDLLCAATSAGEIEEMRVAGTKIPGVVKVSSLVFRGWVEHSAWVDTAIEARCAAA
jgi:DNA-binding Lrp family transcriptional regulator